MQKVMAHLEISVDSLSWPKPHMQWRECPSPWVCCDTLHAWLQGTTHLCTTLNPNVEELCMLRPTRPHWPWEATPSMPWWVALETRTILEGLPAVLLEAPLLLLQWVLLGWPWEVT